MEILEAVKAFSDRHKKKELLAQMLAQQPVFLEFTVEIMGFEPKQGIF